MLSHLAVDRQVSASIQNQAKSALSYRYRQALSVDLPWLDEVAQTKRPRRLPVVLTSTELHAAAHGGQDGTGMRLLERLRPRVKDVEFAQREIVVRAGKGDQDRVPVLPENLMGLLQRQTERARALHDKDLATGFGRVSLPNALAVKYRAADRSWA